jgi:O-antigen/teichoic acid export membrane protein/peptidoglycan/xylan/chitin deacetylase (PgdA/CDA1 family)
MTTMTDTMSTRKAIGISFVTQYVDMTIQFVAVMLLARILSPSEIGTFSVAALLMTMLHVFRDFGVAQYVIQERDLTRDKLQAAMGVAILLALAVAAVLFSIRGLAARFYANPALEDLLAVMSASFAISPFGSLLLSLLRRENKVHAIFYIKTASALCYVGVALLLALRGFGALSLAWANFAGILAFGVVANLLRPPGTPWAPRFRNIRAVLSFGTISSLGNLANIAGTSAPELIVGKVLNMAAVGYLSRATGLVQLFTRLISSALTPLVLPYFSQMRREGKDLAPPYRLAVEQLTALAWPFFAALLLLAAPMIRALYGPQWDAAVPVARLLCVAAAIASVGLFATQAMIANCHVRSSTLCNLLVQPVRIVAVLAASTYGLSAIAAALVASECVALVVTSWFLHRTIGVRPFDLLRACVRSAAITLCTALAPLLVWIHGGDDPANTWSALLTGIAGAACGWIGSIVLTRHPLGQNLLPLLGLGGQPAAGTAPARRGLRAKQLAYRSGLLGAWHRLRNRRSLTVAMFHRVLPRSDPRHPGADPEWTMTPETFAQCLAFFKRHYQVVTAAQVFTALRGEAALPPRSLLVTFDDGWADTAEFAQPVLDRAAVQALVFVAGGAVNRALPFWEEQIYSFLATHPDGRAQLDRAMQEHGLAPLSGPASARMDEAAIRAAIRQLSDRKRDAVLAIASSLTDGSAAFPAMVDARQLAGLAAAGHAIGGHGMSHQPLTRVDDLHNEMRDAQLAVSGFLQQGPIESMSLPHGASSATVLDQCRSAGYRYLFNSESHLNLLDGAGPVRGVPGPVGRIHLPEREITDGGRFQPALLATWLFLRPARAVARQEATDG